MTKSYDIRRYLFFYPADWLTDMALNACSLAAQGAWVRLICFMHQSEEYGQLRINNEPMSEKQIQNLLNVDDNTFKSVWLELTSHGVVKKYANGSYYSKRMVSDYKKFVLTSGDNVISDKNAKIIESIIIYFNQKTKSTYTIDDADTVKLINEKIKNGYKEEDFKKVIDTKCADWLGDEKWGQYLRPRTLFGSKFQDYLNQKNSNTPVKPTHKSNPFADGTI